MIFEESRTEKAIKKYRREIQEPKQRFYPYAHAIILLLVYEVLLRLAFNPRVVDYNGVEFWFWLAESFLPWGTFFISFTIIFHRFFFLYLDWNGIKDKKEVAKDKADKRKNKNFKPKAKGKYRPNWYYFGIMFVEGFVYGSLIYMILPTVIRAISLFVFGEAEPIVTSDNNDTLWQYHTNVAQDFALAFGSGFYDEFIFRLLLIAQLEKVFKKRVKETKATIPVPYLKNDLNLFTIKQNKKLDWTVMLVAALIFSLSHFITPLSEPFNLYGLIYRFIFGIVMYYIFKKTCFPIACWTHVFYDLWYFWLN